MRAPLVVVALLATLAGCALPQGTGSAPRGSYQPLRAFITPPEIGGLGFQVSRPAHVAMFEIVPGRGAALVYPRPGFGPMSRYVSSGRFHLGMDRLAGRDLYLPVHTVGTHSQPRFYFLIASEQPLELSEFGSYGLGLRRVLGSSFASYSPYRMVEQIAEVALPDLVPDGSWTTDLYMHWPEAVSPSAADGFVLLTCNGYSVYVRLAYIWQARQTLCGTSASESPMEPTDSARPPADEVVPRRRPPPEAMTEMRERVRSSAQLQDERAARTRRTPGQGAPGVDRPARSGVDGGVPARPTQRTRPARGTGQEATERGGTSANAPAQTRPEPRERPAPPAREATPRSDPPPASPPQRAEPRPPPQPASTPAPARAPERCADC